MTLLVRIVVQSVKTHYRRQQTGAHILTYICYIYVIGSFYSAEKFSDHLVFHSLSHCSVMLKDKSLIFVQNCPIWLSFRDPVCRLKVPVRPPSAVWSRETPEGPPRDWEEHLKGLSALIECFWWVSSPVPSLC